MAVLGIGSELRGDDAAGLLVARRLQAYCERTRSRRLAAFEGGSAPENLTGVIARFRPEVLVLVDAAHLGKEPGAVEMVPAERIGGVSFSTHMLPVTVLLDYLAKTVGCEPFVLGIEPGTTEVLAKVSPPVLRAVHRVVSAFERGLARRGLALPR